jgi:hypothetical protein
MQAKINVAIPLEHCEIMFGLVDTLEQKNENDPKLVAMIDLIQKIVGRYMNGSQQQSPDTSISTEALYREKMNRVLNERQVQQFKRILKKFNVSEPLLLGRYKIKKLSDLTVGKALDAIANVVLAKNKR